MARGIGGLLGGDNAIEEHYHTPTATRTYPRTPAPSEHDASVTEHENDQLNERWEHGSRRSQKQNQHEVLCTSI